MVFRLARGDQSRKSAQNEWIGHHYSQLVSESRTERHLFPVNPSAGFAFIYILDMKPQRLVDDLGSIGRYLERQKTSPLNPSL